MKNKILLFVSVLLLLFSTVNMARAAFAVYSESVQSKIQLEDIGVSLLENGKEISWRNYKGEGEWIREKGNLLTSLENPIELGKNYPEEIAVKNTGKINEYVRLTITKCWKKDNEKQFDLSPDYIVLKEKNHEDWIEDVSSRTPERRVFYYTKLLPAGQTTSSLSDSFQIDPSILLDVVQEKDDKGTIKEKYLYEGAEYCLSAKVDAIQEHNAADAVLSAWGKHVVVQNNTLSLKGGKP